nr:unnamed protein product [Callosobruchus analis]
MSFPTNVLKNVVAKAGPRRAYHVRKTITGYIIAPCGRRKTVVENPYQQQKVRERSRLVNEAMMNRRKQLWMKGNSSL